MSPTTEAKLKFFHLNFSGKRIGALGISYPIAEKVEAVDEEAAWLKMYEKYEHISRRHCEVIC